MAQKRRRARDVKKLPDAPAGGLGWHQPTAKSRGAGAPPCQDREIHEDAEIRGYAALWRAVFVQQLMDAKSRSSKSEARYNRTMALAWLLDNEVDFSMVCDFAGLDPDLTRSKVREAQKRGFIWSARKPQLTRFEQEQRRRERTTLFDLGILPEQFAPHRVKRRNFATRGIEARQMELTF